MKKEQIILGIDPGYGIVGFGLVKKSGSKLTHISHGVITTPAKIDFVERLKIISTA